MYVSAVSLYRPAWIDASGARCIGSDEDDVTMAVAAIRPLAESGQRIDRIVIVSRAPALLEGDADAVVAHATGLRDVPVEHVLGGAPGMVDHLLAAAPGTAIVGVEPSAPAGAGAILVGDTGMSVTHAGAINASLPLRVRAPGERTVRTYDDPRLLREVVLKPALESLVGDTTNVAVGVPSALHRTRGYDTSLSAAVEPGGPAAVPVALALLAERGSGRLVAIEQAAARALDVDGSTTILRAERRGLPGRVHGRDGETEIPISLAAYARAFEAKVGLRAARCEECGTLSYPPRYRCLACGTEDRTVLVPLPRRATVYTAVTTHVPVPGLASPYSLAIVQLESVDVRMLVQVTDQSPGSVAIGDTGTLVFRKVADRQGVPDYGYAFQPAETESLEVAS